MAELRFIFGTMGSGKSTQALQIRHNLNARGLRTMLFTQLDREVGRVSSRLGVSAEAEVVDSTIDIFEAARTVQERDGLDAVICDESQFYEPIQIEQLAAIVDDLDVEVYAFGLLTSFQGILFPASQRLLELADVRTEMQVEARCWCGNRATHNARLADGVQVYAGQLKVVDTGIGSVTYDLLCRKHWHEGKQAAVAAMGEQLSILDAVQELTDA